MRIRHLLVGRVLLTSPALAPDSIQISGARITPTSFIGSVSKTAESDRGGRFQIIFINGEGDY